METIANFIFTLHLLLIAFILTAPFADNEGILMMHAITIPFILLHWAANDNTCCLTVTEAYFRDGVPRSELFFQKLIGPVYEPRHDSLIILGMLLLLGFSLYKIYERKSKILTVFQLMYEDLFDTRVEKVEKKDKII